MTPQFALRSLAVFALLAGGVNLAHAFVPVGQSGQSPGANDDDGDFDAEAAQDERWAQAELEPSTAGAMKVAGATQRDGQARLAEVVHADHARAPVGDNARPADLAAKASDSERRAGGPGDARRLPGAAQGSQPEREEEAVSSQEARDSEALLDISSSGGGRVARLAAAPERSADVLCNDLDYLRRRLARKQVDTHGIELAMFRGQGKNARVRYIMAESADSDTLQGFNDRIRELRAAEVPLPLVADPGELESADLYTRCTCTRGRAACP